MMCCRGVSWERSRVLSAGARLGAGGAVAICGPSSRWGGGCQGAAGHGGRPGLGKCKSQMLTGLLAGLCEQYCSCIASSISASCSCCWALHLALLAPLPTGLLGFTFSRLSGRCGVHDGTEPVQV